VFHAANEVYVAEFSNAADEMFNNSQIDFIEGKEAKNTMQKNVSSMHRAILIPEK